MKPKAQWPDGPWKHEPDEKRWEDRNTGLECLALRGPVGSWCGYVGVREGHPAYGFSSYKTDFDLVEIASGRAAKQVNVQHQVNEISVHGGLTYAGTDDARGKHLHWYGFDCSHAGDYSPSYEAIEQLGQSTGWGCVVEYRDLAYVMAECGRLAEQLGAINPNKKPERTD